MEFFKVKRTIKNIRNYDWEYFKAFVSFRVLEGMECLDGNCYGRSFCFDSKDANVEVVTRLAEARKVIADSDAGTGRGTGTRVYGVFFVEYLHEQSCFKIIIEITDKRHVDFVMSKIKHCLDLEADGQDIEKKILRAFATNEKEAKAAIKKLPSKIKIRNIRIPKTWDAYEAAIRAICGQQVSVSAAKKIVLKLIEYSIADTDMDTPKYHSLYKKNASAAIDTSPPILYFPTPTQLLENSLENFKMPGTRKGSLHRIARYAQEGKDFGDTAALLAMQGIGPWTVNSIQMNGRGDRDIFLDGDLGIKKAIAMLADMGIELRPELASPYRSYLTIYLWEQLG